MTLDDVVLAVACKITMRMLRVFNTVELTLLLLFDDFKTDFVLETFT